MSFNITFPHMWLGTSFVLIDGGSANSATSAVNASNPEHERTSKFFGGLHATADALNRVWSISSVNSQFVQGKEVFRDPFSLLAPQLTELQTSLLSMLGSGHPTVADIKYFLHTWLYSPTLPTYHPSLSPGQQNDLRYRLLWKLTIP